MPVSHLKKKKEDNVPVMVTGVWTSSALAGSKAPVRIT